MTKFFDSVAACVDATLERVGRDVVLALPLGLGKPNALANEFFRRALREPALHLKIMTALSLRRPAWSSDLERRLLEPLAARIFGNCPDLDYVTALHAGRLPSNVEVCEFYFEPGANLRIDHSQQRHLCVNYTDVAREVLAQANVMGQMVATRVVDGRVTVSLSSNPDVTLDLLPHLAERRASGRPLWMIAAVNRQMPYMVGDAEVPLESFDHVVEDPSCDHDLFCPPNLAIGTVEHLIGLYASSLIKDGGTLQMGIGELGDAIVYSMQLRHQQPQDFARVLDTLAAERRFPGLIARIGGTQPFAEGLYACTEMFADGFLDLYRSGILKRRVHPHAAIQRGINEGRIGDAVGPAMLDWLIECGIGPALRPREFEELLQAGLFRAGVRLEEGTLIAPDGASCRADLADPSARATLLGACLAPRLDRGVLLHGGFFLGPKAFYQELRELPESERARFNLTRISFVNQLLGPDSELKRLQRRHARFINTTMMVTLMGAAISDGLDDGRVVSGVGGQYNFVAMAHSLPDGRSILAVRSTRNQGARVTSNLLWNYAHTTIPRHLRDLVITEYGIADLRGKTDSDVIAALLDVCDSRFQETLLRQAKAAGKIARDHVIPAIHRNNTPRALATALAPFRKRGLFPELPFGSDFTREELLLGAALKRLKARTSTPLGKAMALTAAFVRRSTPGELRPCLERLQLDQPKTMSERLLRNLVAAELMRSSEAT